MKKVMACAIKRKRATKSVLHLLNVIYTSVKRHTQFFTAKLCISSISKELHIIRNLLRYIIKPQENARWRVMIYTALCTVMIYQACGMDKKEVTFVYQKSLLFWPARRDLNPRSLESESNAISNFATGGYKSILL